MYLKIETEKNKFYFYSFNLQKIYTRENVERKKKQKERVNNWVKGTPQQHTILFWDLSLIDKYYRYHTAYEPVSCMCQLEILMHWLF